ncbi:MAG: phosphatidate cytidylyltransferase [Fimbriimonadaceae bacterium]
MKSRVITSLVVMPIVLAAITYTQTWPLMILGGLVVLVACWELFGLFGARYWGTGLIPYGIVVLAFWQPHGLPTWIGFFSGLAALTAVGAFFAHLATKQGWTSAKLTVAGLWIAVPIGLLVGIHLMSNMYALDTWRLAEPLLLILIPLWAADIAGILVGMAIGKHLLAPKISPKKTIEGGIGNLLAAVGVAIPLSIWLGYDWTIGLYCGLAIGILGQAGDLFESWLKRRAGVKDSGTILPGHGGVLDRIDSLLFSAPVVCLILVNAQRV